VRGHKKVNRVFEAIDFSCEIGEAKEPVQLVRELSFSLFSGKTMAIVGESGSGKTTTALSILQLLYPIHRYRLKGQFLFQNQNLTALKEKELRSIRGKEIAMIFQDPETTLNPVFTIGDQIAEMALLHLQISEEEARTRTVELLQKVGVPHAKRAFEIYPHELSGGMKQRAMIAMALIANPKILIADEPTTALDVTIQKEVLQLLKKEMQERGMALLLITHDMGVVSYMADSVAVMYAGEIVEAGPVAALFEKRLHPYTEALFQARPSKEKRKKPLQVTQGSAPLPGQLPPGCPYQLRCPFAMPRCKEGKVAFFYDTPEHFAKCWLLEKK
jgi:oligopeptide/dipeptide ABC transporter ATP-binding protein